jgi:hypothetical protein
MKIHSNRLSEDDTGYDSALNQSDSKELINSTTGLSSASSSQQIDHILNLVKAISSPTDISTSHQTSDIVLSVKQRIARFSQQIPISTRKINRTRVQPLPDSTSDSADSFAVSNHLLVSSYNKPLVHTPTISSIDLTALSSSLEYIHDDRFDSTTTVDHMKNDIIAIEFIEPTSNQSSEICTTIKPPSSWIRRVDESIRLLPANLLTIVFFGLLGGILVSALLLLIIA